MAVKTAGRPYNATDTPLGRIMWDRGIRVHEIAHATKINARTLTEYLAARKPMQHGHRALLSDYLDIDPRDLAYEVIPGGTQPGSIPIGHPLATPTATGS